MLCCVQLSSNKGPCFVLHILPGSTDPDPGDQHRNNHSQTFSRAAEARGVQVFPGNVKEVAKVSALVCCGVTNIASLYHDLAYNTEAPITRMYGGCFCYAAVTPLHGGAVVHHLHIVQDPHVCC
jgi:hypothetical protein